MKVLLIGEYSGVHTNLAKELKKKGHMVYVISDGDGYKKIGNPDLLVSYNILKSNNLIFSFLIKVYYVLMEFLGLKGFFSAIGYIKKIKNLNDYDVVQLINTRPFSSFSSLGNLVLLHYIFKHNKRVFLCALGDDYTWVKYCLDGNLPYSKFDRFKFKYIGKFLWPLVYVYGVGFKLLDRYVVKNSKKIIPGLFDYYIAYKESDYNYKLSEIVPLPIELLQSYEGFNFKGYPIKIFHGWQPGKELAKGNDIFDKAIKKLILKYPEKVEYEIVGGIPYEEYLRKFSDSTIYIDQCYSLDRGMNGLLGMEAGKVVFTGFNEGTANYYNMTMNQCAIDAPPNEYKIFEELENLILNPSIIEKISREAILFVKRHHDSTLVAEKYITIWNS